MSAYTVSDYALCSSSTSRDETDDEVEVSEKKPRKRPFVFIDSTLPAGNIVTTEAHEEKAGNIVTTEAHEEKASCSMTKAAQRVARQRATKKRPFTKPSEQHDSDTDRDRSEDGRRPNPSGKKRQISSNFIVIMVTSSHCRLCCLAYSSLAV